MRLAMPPTVVAAGCRCVRQCMADGSVCGCVLPVAVYGCVGCARWLCVAVCGFVWQGFLYIVCHDLYHSSHAVLAFVSLKKHLHKVLLTMPRGTT